MSELRQDRTSGRWVIIAPKRAQRPGALLRGGESAIVAPERPRCDPNCPFCPGHENRLPGIVAETRIDRAPGWSVRVVPNKFPALQADPKVESSDRHSVAEGYGFHEVIIENPRHDADLVSMAGFEIEAVVSAYRDRSRQLLGQPGIEAVVLFRNHGSRGGASQPHPHAQVLALGAVPSRLAARADWSERYYRANASCPTCDEIKIERELKKRVVEDGRDFIVLVPFAAEHPCETWIVPKRHQASFSDLADPQCRELGRALRRALYRLRCARDDPPYNFVIDSAARSRLKSPCVHWRLRIAPDLATAGGFELGAGMAINPSRPEDDAALLRASESEARDSRPCGSSRK
jgi:UDPglucose--hexose-1-phosphate uridylyltransferase